MGEGLFFWLILIGVAVLQGIGQKKRKPGQGLPGPKPRGPRPPTQARPRRPGPDPEGSGLSSDEGTSSEAMIPADVWEEILGLARGTPGSRKGKADPAEEMEEVPTFQAEDPLPMEGERRVSGESETERESPLGVVSRSQRAPAARGHPKFGRADRVLDAARPVASGGRLGEPLDWKDREMEGSAASVRAELFGGGTLKELRKAIVHQEVLGKPVALREDG